MCEVIDCANCRSPGYYCCHGLAYDDDFLHPHDRVLLMTLRKCHPRIFLTRNDACEAFFKIGSNSVRRGVANDSKGE